MAKKITSEDVAREAGVSRTTVSFVLNNTPHTNISEETRQRVLEVARRLGYRPDAAARALARRETRIIGLVLCQSHDRVSADAFLPEVIRGLSHSAQSHGFKVLLEPVEDVTRPDAYIALVQERRIDGIVLSGPRSDDAQLPRLIAEGFPLVLLGQLQGVRAHFADVDNVAGARRAVEHLLDLGHTRIALITNAPLHYTASRDRLQGYREALMARGLPVDEHLIRLGDFRSESGYAAMQSLLNLPEPPTAVFAASDVVAFGAVSAIKDRGLRIPDDIALVGFDDVPLARYVDPPLTTIRLPAWELGARAGALLLEIIAHGNSDEPLSVLLPTELVVRESCGAHLHQRANGGSPLGQDFASL